MNRCKTGLALASAAAAVVAMSAGAAFAGTPAQSWLMKTPCTTFLPVARANAATGGAYAITKVVTAHRSNGIVCNYANADWPGPQGTAPAVGIAVYPATTSTKKYFAFAQTQYAKAAVASAASPACQPDAPEAPQGDVCTLWRPFGASSFGHGGYWYIMAKGYLVLVSRGGADYTTAGLSGLATAVVARLH